MTTSGSATREISVLEIVEDAYEQCGVEMRTGYQLRSAIRSLDLLMMEWANRGINLWTVDQASISTVSGTVSYNISDDVVDIINMSIDDGEIDLVLDRYNMADYTSLATQGMLGRPTAFWLKRTTVPVVYLYPVPDAVYTVNYWIFRRIYDAGAGGNTMDVPFRFLPALIAGLAQKLAAKNPELTQRVPLLEAEYEKQFRLAAEEDRDKTSLFVRVKKRRW